MACKDVQLEDFLFYHPCGWCTWFLDCDRVQCRGVRIECHPQYPNGDGLHFGGCRDVTVSDCIIHSQDDSLIIRTHQEQMKTPRPCERVTIENCVLSANQSAIRFGWTEDYAMRDVVISGIVCQHSRLGVQFNLPPNNDDYHIDPPRDRTESQASRNDRALPRCSAPVGLGASRPRTFVFMLAMPGSLPDCLLPCHLSVSVIFIKMA